MCIYLEGVCTEVEKLYKARQCLCTRSSCGRAASLWGSRKRRGEQGGTICSLKTMDLENGVLAGFWWSSMGVCHGQYITSHHIVLFFISFLQFLPLGDLDAGAFGGRDGNYWGGFRR